MVRGVINTGWELQEACLPSPPKDPVCHLVLNSLPSRDDVLKFTPLESPYLYLFCGVALSQDLWGNSHVSIQAPHTGHTGLR